MLNKIPLWQLVRQVQTDGSFFALFLSAPAVMKSPSPSGDPDANGLAAASLTPQDARDRRRRAFQIRLGTAIFERDQPIEPSFSNGDEQRYEKQNYQPGACEAI